MPACRYRTVLSLSLFIAMIVPAAAQTGSDVVVSATRLPTPTEEVASTVTVVTGEEIQRRQLRTLADVLLAVPGLYVAQSGGAGKSARVFMRGTEARHTLVLIDGIEIQDPSSPDGAFEFQHLTTDDIERVEVLRGPQSTLYGSDAIGGVINIITKRGKGPARATAAIEAGSFGSFNQRAGLAGSSGRYDYAFNLSHLRSDGISVTPKRLRPTGATNETDGYDNTTLSAKLGAALAENLDVTFVTRYAATRSDLDVSPEDPNSQERTRQLFGRGEIKLSLFEGRFDQRLGVGFTRYDRTDTDRADSLSAAFSDASNESDKLKLDWQGDVYLTENHVLTAGLETEEESAKSASDFSSGFSSRTDNSARNNAGLVQMKSAFGNRLFATLGARIDDHENFGSKVTWRVAPAYLHRETDTKLKATYGTGFRAPTLFQLYGRSFFGGFGIFAGNPNLQPEESRGWDAGVEQGLFDRRLTIGSTYFRTDIDNLIDFNDSFTSLVNRSTAHIHGVESFARFAATENVTLQFDHTFAIAENGATGGLLRRRPKHKAAATADWRITDRATVGVTALFVGERVDADAVTFADKRMSSYMTLNLGGTYDVAPSWTVFGRIENLFDRDYEDPDGFQRPGIAGFAGVRVRF